MVIENIALIDTEWQGHHSGHFKHYTKTLLELGYQVIAFCPNPTELSEWVTDNCPEQVRLLHAFDIGETEGSSFPIGRIRRSLITLACWRQATTAIQKALEKIGKQPDLVFFPWLDSYLAPYITYHSVDQIFPYKWIGIYHLPSHLRMKQRFESLRRGLLNPDAVLYSPQCLAVGVHDEGIAEKLKNKINGKSVVVFPNFTDESPPEPNFPLVKEILKKARGRKIIGLIGSQGRRKGLLTLLEIAQKSVQEDWFFVFVGELAEHSFPPQERTRVQSIISSNPDNCFFHFGHVPGDSQFNALAKVCDVLWVVYKNFVFSSQILTVAAIFEKPVIAQDSFCIGERVKKYRLGLTVPEDDISKCIEALRGLCNHLDSIEEWLKPKFQEYKSFQSTEQLRLSIEDILSVSIFTKNDKK